MAAIHGKLGGKLKKKFRKIGWQQVHLPPGVSVEQAMAFYKKFEGIETVQPNYVFHALATPNDPRYGSQWDMVKIGAPTAWNSTTGSDDDVVAVIDTGVDYNHSDLAANMWHNPGEIPGNGKDDDGNGYVDDVYGVDAANGDADPLDDENHGTHCAGTIGAVGNNSVGVTGVNWNVKIMALKFLDSSGSGYDTDAITCLEYAITMRQRGVNIVATSNSWGGPGYSSAMKNAFDAAYNAGIINVCAAGNDGYNNDGSNPDYPSSYNSAGIISVAASDSNDARASFSNYGATSVDLAAPGVSILSTLRNNSYGSYSGTSMATPHVAGAIGLLASYSGGLSAAQLKQTILSSVDVLPNWQGYVLTGGRLNIAKALNGAAPAVNRQADLRIRNASESAGAASGDNIYNTTGTGQNRAQTISNGSTASFRITVQNDGEQSEPLVMTAPATGSGWTLAYFDAGNNNITSAVTGSGWTTASLAPGATTEIEARITASTPTTTSRTIQITAASTGDSTKKDTVSATASLPVQPDLMIRTSAETDAQYALDNTYQSTPSGGQIKSLSAAVGSKVAFNFKLQNDTSSARTFVLKASESALKPSGWSLVYKNSSGTNITSQLRSASGYTSRSLSAGAYEILTVNITAVSGTSLTSGDSIAVDLKAFVDSADVTNNTVRDAVRAVVSIPPPLVVGVDALARNFGEINFIGGGVINTTGASQTVSQNALRNQLVTYYARVTNTGNSDDNFKLAGAMSDSYWNIKYTDDDTGVDITSTVGSGKFTTPLLAPGQSFNIRIEVMPNNSAAINSSKSILLTATSKKNSLKKDAIKATTTVVTGTSSTQPPPVETNPDGNGVVTATLTDRVVRLGFGGAGILLVPDDATNPLLYTVTVNGQFVVPKLIQLEKSTGDILITLSDKARKTVVVQWSDLPTQTGGTVSGTAQINVP
jgi:subtilisin family serine protease